MDKFELAAHGANEALWDWDLISNRIHFSERWNSLLGEESMLGSNPEDWFRRIHPEDLEQVRREIDAHLQNGSHDFTIQHRMLHQDGSYRFMDCRGIIARDKDGRGIRIMGASSDTTPEKVVDTLTGLPNRILLMDRLTRSIKIARRHPERIFALLILDLDRSGQLMERLGESASDKLVVAAARRLETCLREEDTITRPHDHVVARSGGDEFIILLDGLNEVGESKLVAERLLKEISAPFQLDGREVFFSASIGIALSATGYQNAHEAFRDASTALHRAKSLGKGRCEVFDTGIFRSAQARLELESDLQDALERGEFQVAYQPIIALETDKIAGFEALARWEHPVRGMVSPEEYIPVAESSGLIVPLGRMIMREACIRLKKWKESCAEAKDLWISVNLSGLQFKHPALVKDICGILIEFGSDANGLVLELTEGEVMENPEAARRLLMQLHVTGARIALDDFGTGYSSLAYLCRFPLDYLKIDRSFVKNVETNNDAREIVKSISGLAHQLGLRVIAEGIENAEQLELIRSLECEYGQGFFFSKPLFVHQAEALLADGCTFQKTDASVKTGAESLVEAPVPNPESAKVPAGNRDNGRALSGRNRGEWRRGIVPLMVGTMAFVLLLTAGLLTGTQDPATMPSDEEANMPILSDMEQTPLESPKKQLKQKVRASVFNYPVVHDHLIGNCKGTLKVSGDTVAYIGDNEGCSTDFSLSEFTYTLKKDSLEIINDSKTFHFKARKDLAEADRESQLRDILRKISSIYKGPKAEHP